MTESDTIKKKLTKSALLEALKQSLGVVAQACQTVDISRQTYYKWLKQDEEFAREVSDISEHAIDFVESQLFKQIQKESTSATIFYLKTKGKHRGYVETQEVSFAKKSDVPTWWTQDPPE